MQINHLLKNCYKIFLIKNENGVVTKNIIIDLFFNFKIFNVF